MDSRDRDHLKRVACFLVFTVLGAIPLMALIFFAGRYFAIVVFVSGGLLVVVSGVVAVIPFAKSTIRRRSASGRQRRWEAERL